MTSFTINEFEEIYQHHFADKFAVDDTLKQLLLDSKWQEAFDYTYKNDVPNVFKLLYLYADVKFPVQALVEIEEKIMANAKGGCILAYSKLDISL